MSDMRLFNASIAVAILLIVPASVKAASADEPATLNLDSGFVGRVVSLELFSGRVIVKWDKGTLVKPTVLRVMPGVAATGTRQTVAGDAWRIEFADEDAIGKAGKISIIVRAHRPPSQGERAELNAAMALASASDAVTSSSPLVTTNAVFGGKEISGTVMAAASFTVTPAWGDGIMRQGKASWYAYKKCLCAASPDVPKGTRLLVSRDDPSAEFIPRGTEGLGTSSSRSVVVTVNDWGPERDKHPDRVIDLDKVAFKRIGDPRGGVMSVRVEVIPRDDPRWKLGDELPPPNWKKLLASLKE